MGKGRGCGQEPLEPWLSASQYLAKHSLPSQGGQPLPSALISGCYSSLVINSVFVSPPTWAPGARGQRLGEGSLWRRESYKESGRRRRSGAAGEQAWGVGSKGMRPLDSTHPDCTFQQVCIPSENARIPEMWKYLGNGPWSIRILGDEESVWGASNKEAPERNLGMRILWESSISPPDSYTRVQCAHAHRWTDTHTCTHTIYSPSA